MNILVTGSKGFIAKNLILRLKSEKINILEFNKINNFSDLEDKIIKSDIIFHLAGENRSDQDKNYYKNNLNLTEQIAEVIKKRKLNKKIIFSSTAQVIKSNIYGKTKLLSEKALKECTKKTKSIIKIYRIPNVFGKWSRPNYNSIFATFAYNISRYRKINLFNSNKKIKFIYIDDLIDIFIKDCKLGGRNQTKNITNYFSITPKKLAETLIYFREKRNWFGLNDIEKLILKKMYSSYLTYISTGKFTYKLKKNLDVRGYITEFLRMGNAGQISCFTINKGKVRGLHYHHTKIEKFMILKGKVRFDFKNLSNGKIRKFYLKENDQKVIETVPGWLHTLKNIGIESVIGIIWTNEEFDIKKTDTYYIDE